MTLLRAILLTLNQSAIPGGTPTVPPSQEGPPNRIVTATGLMYASLLISLLAAFVAMLGKQWLNRYLRNAGGSMIGRCGDRQRKCDGIEKWPLHLFVEGLPVMLQVAYTLITLTGFGVLFYLAIVTAGVSSYACPFQTPGSTALRSQWKNVQPRITSLIFHSRRAFSWTRRMWNRKIRRRLRRQSLRGTPLDTVQVQQPEP